ncbi:MAG TPA: hypothetical protein VE987_18320, partial [Polyangiaceae bacterium]|nr:hypothetical protein [Polyangiaceae bacterium]
MLSGLVRLVAMVAALAAAGCARSGSHHASMDAGAMDAAVATGCNPGELALDDGGCQPAGIPPGMCAMGFMPDGNGGCLAILPPPCQKGQMAVPGDTSCHDVAPCAA